VSIILATDTSTAVNSVAVCQGSATGNGEMELLAEAAVHCDRRHAERLLPVTDFVLQEAGLTLADVQLLAVSIGPGSFTGLRLGVATWKGLALARDLPLIAVPTLDALSRIADLHGGHVCTLLDARMEEVYGALYRYHEGVRDCLVPAMVGPVERILADAPRDTLFAGDGALRYADRIQSQFPDALFLPGHHGGPRAGAVAAEAFSLIAAGADTCADAVSPVYLRKSQAEMSREAAASGGKA
jgi:tRNA threonylcarbamoyladenosine biosynthesis protein TsaB